MRNTFNFIFIIMLLIYGCSSQQDSFHIGHWKSEKGGHIFIDDLNMYVYEDKKLTAMPYKVFKTGKNSDGRYILIVHADGTMSEILMPVSEEKVLVLSDLTEGGEKSMLGKLFYVDDKLPKIGGVKKLN